MRVRAICDHVWTQRATAAGFASRSTKIASAFGSGFEWHSPKNAADKAARAGIGLYDIAAFQCGFERRHFLTTVDLGERDENIKDYGPREASRRPASSVLVSRIHGPIDRSGRNIMLRAKGEVRSRGCTDPLSSL